MVLPAAVSGVSFDSIDDTILDSLDDSGMIRFAILRSGRSLRIIPVKEDYHFGNRFLVSVDPLISFSEPVDTITASCVFGNDTIFDVAAFVRTPAHEAGTPFNTGSESIPGPVCKQKSPHHTLFENAVRAKKEPAGFLQQALWGYGFK